MRGSLRVGLLKRYSYSSVMALVALALLYLIIICITAHQCVITDILTAISVNVWPYQCMSGNQSMYMRMSYIQSNVFLFLFITQIILIVFFCGNKSLI